MEDKIEISLKKLKRIAEYYGFPLAVFFLEDLPEQTTRDQEIRKKAEAFDKIKEIVKNLEVIE